ncbi:MAG: hypothetical protein FI734_05190 [SAR202 cluster bacterium]|nr:hypothetical protein [SAR202 cluster bacterium]|tara:strand:- start:24539 stop:25225 length:687 start_codon:yes stop_codon:yes gene_type:complete
MDSANSQAVIYPSLLNHEQFQAGFDSRKGIINDPNEAGPNSTLITNLRLINRVNTDDAVTITSLPVGNITSTEIIRVSKSNSKLFRSILLMASGIIIGWSTWLLLDVIAITLIFGGLPGLIGFYLLMGWVIPDTENMLCFYSNEKSINQALHTKEAELSVHPFILSFYNYYFNQDISENNQVPSKIDHTINRSPDSTFGGTGTPNPLENAILANLKQSQQNYEEKPES